MILSHCPKCCANTETTDGGRCFECGTPKNEPARAYPTSPNEPQREIAPPMPRWGSPKGSA